MHSFGKFFAVLLALGYGFSVSAEEIYKHVGDDGVVEYSDTPTPDAKEIEVDPNVVEVAPEKRPTESAPPVSAQKTKPEVIEGGEDLEADRYYGGEERRRQEVLHEAAERPKDVPKSGRVEGEHRGVRHHRGR